MKSKISKNLLLMFAQGFLLSLMAGVGSGACARDGGGFHGGGFHGGGFHDHGWSRGYAYPHAWGGFYIGTDWFWGPTVVVAGIPYYYYNGYYYTPDGDVFVVTTPPVAAAPAAPSQSPQPAAAPAAAPAPSKPLASANPDANAILNSGDEFTVNVPNASGGYTAVKLVKGDKGYIGPQGEFYPSNPTIAELKVLYGK